MNKSKLTSLFVGSYTQKLPHVHGKADGIYSCRFNEGGTLAIHHTMAGIENPSYITLSPDKNYLYAAQEGSSVAESGVFAYAVDAQNGELMLLNEQSAYGVSPCHLCTDGMGKFLFLANYSSGNVLVYPLAEDGRIQDPVANIQHTGSGPNHARQEGPHVHMVLPTADNQYLLVADLGIDALVVYRFDEITGQLHRHSSSTAVSAGAGPRHMAFHPNGRILFAVNELDSTVTSFRFVNGQLTPVQTLSTLPETFSDASFCAAIRVGGNGRYVYASNRGHDSIVTFAFDDQTEQLIVVDYSATGGQTPRDFILMDDILLAANQDSNTIVHFQIDELTGVPHPTGQISEVPTPVCLVY